jgi:hypothetical protein
MASAAKSPDPSSTLRSVLSLFLFVHFFCIFAVLASTYRRSLLQIRLVGIFGPYTELLAFDPGFYTPFYYTQGRLNDDDAIIAVDLYPDGESPVAGQQLIKTVTLPSGGSPWLGERGRTIVLAKRLAEYADPETGADELSGELARGVGARLMRESGARRAVVRCVRRLSQPLDLSTLYANFPADNPTAAAYDEVVYEADVWIDEDNIPQVQRRVAAAEAAPRRTSPPSNQRGGTPANRPPAPESRLPAPGSPPATP